MYVILLAIMVFISATLAGMFAPPFEKPKEVPPTQNGYQCCDTGNGEACHPLEQYSFTFSGKKYALLKSNILPIDTMEHAEKHFAPASGNKGDGSYVDISGKGRSRIFSLNWEKKGDDNVSATCQGKDKDKTDWMIGSPGEADPKGKNEHAGKGCYAIPNGLLLYVCRPDNDPSECDQGRLPSNEIQFDAYIRLDDIQAGGALGGIPEQIKNCALPPPPPPPEKFIVFRPSPVGQDNLQLRTFSFIEREQPLPFLAPYCKPAIYLYPKVRTEVNVSVFPQGKMLLTIPPYPKLGWDVVADPNGDITYKRSIFDYLYYEASIPDELIQKPKEGYIMSYDERETFLRNLVIKLGLNEKETNQFVEYWTPVLPKSPYYFVGVVPTEKLHEISPLVITPRPDRLIRITLYFQPLVKKIMVSPPELLPINRDGFTAVEWGGIFKQDKNHPFSCFM